MFLKQGFDTMTNEDIQNKPYGVVLTNGIIKSAGIAVGIMKGNLGLTAFDALEITR